MKNLHITSRTFLSTSAVASMLVFAPISFANADVANASSIKSTAQDGANKPCVDATGGDVKAVCKDQIGFTQAVFETPAEHSIFSDSANASVNRNTEAEVKTYALVLAALGFVAMLKRRRQRNVGMALA